MPCSSYSHPPPTTQPTTTIPQGTFVISTTRTRAFRVLVPWCGTTQHSSFSFFCGNHLSLTVYPHHTTNHRHRHTQQ